MLKDLSKDVKIVAYARFNKVRRLRRKNSFSLISISLISLLLIVISLSENVFNVDEIKPILFLEVCIDSWFFSVLSSIAVLVMSIAISSAKYESQAEKLYESAMRLNSLRRDIEFGMAQSVVFSLTYYNNKYQSILLENSVNHDELDWRIAKAKINKVKVSLWDIVMNLIFVWVPFLICIFISISVMISILIQVSCSYAKV